MLLGPDRAGHLLVEVVHVVRDEVGQFGVLGVIPALLDRVEFRRISRQPLPVEPGRAMGRKKAGRGSMGPQPAGDDKDPAPRVAVQLPEKPDEFLGANVDRPQLVVQPQPPAVRRDRNHADGGQAVVAIPGMVDRGVARRRPGSQS